MKARELLRGGVAKRAARYGVCPGGVRDGGDVPDDEKTLRRALAEAAEKYGFDRVTEEAAFTWFLRLAALRLMEASGFLPPAPAGELTDEACRRRIASLCVEFEEWLPGDFSGTEDYTPLLLPDDLCGSGLMDALVNGIPEEWFDLSSEGSQPGVMGWLYQYYLTDRHEAVVNPLHGKKVSREDIPAATQLFTPEWVAKFLTENAAGRFWVERHPESGLAGRLEYLVTREDSGAARTDEGTALRDLTVLDPCVGSGIFLTTAFDLLLKIYTEQGVSPREAAAVIVRDHLYGLDIDRRVVKLARFCVAVKARTCAPDFFARGVTPRIYQITDGSELAGEEIRRFCGDDEKLSEDVGAVLRAMEDAGEAGSLLTLPALDFRRIDARLDEYLRRGESSGRLGEFFGAAAVMSRTYAAVVTNPPYFNRYDDRLKAFLDRHYRSFSGDLFSAFMKRNMQYCRRGGYAGFLTPFVWMFIRKYGPTRREIIDNCRIATLVQFEYSAYEEATVPLCAFVLANDRRDEPGGYVRLTGFRGGMEVQRRKTEEALRDPDGCGYFYRVRGKDFDAVPSSPIAYWAGEEIRSVFRSAPALGELALARNGMKTGDNTRFLRLWWEVDPGRLKTDCRDCEEAKASGAKWFPYNKGGEFRKWYGNNDYVVNWEHAGESVVGHAAADGRHVQDYPDGLKFVPSLTWSLVTSSRPSFRLKEGSIADIAGMSLYGERDLLIRCLGLLNSRVAEEILEMLAPTINFQAGDIARVPAAPALLTDGRIPALVERCVALSRADWDSFETSWNFSGHPLLRGRKRLSDAFDDWSRECEQRFEELRRTEEELNRLFIEMYGLEGRLSPDVPDSEVTVRRADLGRDIRGLLSYAVGCLFGRFSPGAGYGFSPCGGILPLSEGGLPHDAAGRFREFLREVFGEETLEENMRFVARALGRTGDPEDAVRSYFLNEFFVDHCRLYKKRPVYWLIDSGRRGGFRCLVYYHSLRRETLREIRERYILPLLGRTLDELSALENGGGSTRTLKKRLADSRSKAEALVAFEKKLDTLAGMPEELNPDDGVIRNYAKLRGIVPGASVGRPSER